LRTILFRSGILLPGIQGSVPVLHLYTGWVKAWLNNNLNV